MILNSEYTPAWPSSPEALAVWVEVYVVPPLPVPVHKLDAADEADGSHGAQDHQLLTGGWGTVNKYLQVFKHHKYCVGY